jgi:signal transduction histidine kinase
MQSQDIGIPFIFILGTLVMFAMALLVVIFVFKYQRKLMTDDRERQQIFESNQLELLNNSIQVQEEERDKISSDLHDEIGALLSTCKLNLRSIETNNFTNEEKLNVLQETRKLLDLMNSEIRNISVLLSPYTVTNFGLNEALKEYLNRINLSELISLHFNGNYNRGLVTARTELVLYRIAQELLNNIIKHASPMNIYVDLRTEEGRLILIIKDDGIQIDGKANQNKTSSGIGLKNIQSRLQILNAKANYEYMEGIGTTVTISMSL